MKTIDIRKAPEPAEALKSDIRHRHRNFCTVVRVVDNA